MGSEGPTVATVAKIPFKPIKPKFGDISEVGTDSWAAWTGGKPKADWSGLEDSNPTAIAATQYRPTSISSQAKSQTYRVQGLTTKFTRTSDLQTFEKKIMKHLISYGLDTITYATNPTDPTKVVSVVDHHALFNLKEGSKTGNDLKKNKFDSYDHANDRDAKEFLLNSVDAELESQLYENCEDEDSFVTLWLNLIHIIRSVSIDRFDKVKDRIKNRKMSDYSGENVESISSDFLSDWKDLHGARLYDQNLTMTMLNTIMQAGGTVNEDFRYPLREIKSKLDCKLLAVRHMNYIDAHSAMVAEELDVQSVLKAAKKEYRTLYDDDKWPAAAHAKDTKSMNGNYGSVNIKLVAHQL